MCVIVCLIRLTFLLELVIVQQQADHLFGFQRVWFEVASRDYHSLDLITQEQKALIDFLINLDLQHDQCC